MRPVEEPVHNWCDTVALHANEEECWKAEC
jgi:hypothetical protein